MRLNDSIMATAILTFTAALAWGQSSSLYLMEPEPPQRMYGKVAAPAELDRASYTAVLMPEPREFKVHDLVTIIVRESASASSTSGLETNKEVELDGSIDAFPSFQLKDLLELQLNPSTMDDGSPQVKLGMENEFEGEGEYSRRDDVTLRITAQVVDIKPNGNLALEAVKHIKNDKEELEIRLTGYCRSEDVTVDNTVLSTQMHGLRLEKQHKGELRNASKKGVLTKILEFLFNF